jgi:hypothetical protein
MIRWNEVTWYSRLSALIIFLAILPCLTFYVGMQYQAVIDQPPTVAITTNNNFVSKSSTTPQLMQASKYRGCPNYYKDTVRIYSVCRGGTDAACLLSGTTTISADLNTFKVLTQANGFTEYDCDYAVDAKNVFYGGQIIAGADPMSFKGLGIQNIAHDLNSVYYRNSKIGTLNGATVKALPIDQFSNEFYLNDGNQVYYFGSNIGLDNSGDYSYAAVRGTDPSSFKLVSGVTGVDSQDTNHDYYRGAIVQ